MLSAGGTAFGCSCASFDAPQEFERMNYVFVGRVVATGGFLRDTADFAVEKAWKPMDADEVTVYESGCDGMELIEGETYLVYAYKEEGIFGTKIYTGSCTRTKVLTKAADDLKFLEDKPTVPVPQATMSANMRIGLTAVVFFALFLSVGFALKKILKH